MADFPRASPAKWWKTASIGRVHRSPHAMHVGWVRRWLSIGALILLALLIGTVWYLTNPKRLSVMSGLLLSHVLGANVTVHNAALSWTGMLRLTGVRLRTNPGKVPATTLFSADQVQVRFNWLGLVSGRLHASEITAIRPMLNLVDDLDTRQWNYEGFVQSGSKAAGRSKLIHPPTPVNLHPLRLPAFNLRNAVVRWGEIRHGVYRMVGQSLINVELGPSLKSHSTYQLDLEQQTAAGRKGLVLTGLYNISTREFSAHVNRLKFTDGFRRALPAQVQQFWRKLHLHGGVRNVIFQVSPAGGLHVQARLHGVSIQTTAPSRRLGPQIISLTNLNGHVAISNTGFQISRLRGTIMGWKFGVPSARFDGYQSGAPFNLTVVLPALNIPLPYPKIFATRDFSVAQAIFYHLRPSGLMNVTVHIERAQLHGVPTVHGVIDCRNMRARYVNFPYPMEHVHGLIRFSAHHIQFFNVRAIAESFPVSLNGRVAINEKDGPINLTISSSHVAYDRRLAACLPLDIRPIWNRFNPVGFGGFVCHVTHAAGTGGNPRIVLHIFPRDVSGAYRDLPFPLHHVHGSLIFTDHETKIIKLEAPVAAHGHIIFTGKVTYSPNDLSKLRPRVHLQAVGIPINQTLLGSLPGSWAHWIKLLHVQRGFAGLNALITRGQGGKPAVYGELTVNHTVMTPPQLPWPLHDVTALADLRSGGLVLKSMTAQTGADGKGILAVAGAIVEPDTGPVRIRADGSWKNIQIAAAAPSRLPAALATFWNNWKLRGCSDGSFTYSLSVRQNRLTGAVKLRHQQYQVQLMPRGMQVAPAFLPAPLSAITGEVNITPGIIGMKNLQADSGMAHLTISGAYQTTAEALQLSLQAHGSRLPQTWMSLIPGSTRLFINGLKPSASWFLQLPTLQRIKVGKAYRWRFTGSLVLNDLATTGDIRLQAKQAIITIAGDLAPGTSFPMLDGQFGVTQLNWDGKIADPLAGYITADSATHTITIDQINGKVAGGNLTGTIRIHIGKHASYAVACQLHGSQLAGLLRRSAATPEAKGIRTSTGIVDASLILDATLGNHPTRQGSGQMVIHKARIYDVPMAMGLMQIATLRLPISSNFHHASVRYTIHNNVVRFNPISLRSTGMNLVGEGTLNLKTTALNLRLLTQSPQGTRVPVLGWLFGLARSQLLELRVSGAVAHPTIAPVPLRFLAWPFIGFGP
ncbi:MAG: AsmA-like C-terminal region-containing protein [Phycisphaerae bacterium]